MMEVYDEKRWQVAVLPKSMEELLNSQMELYNGQVGQLGTLFTAQCSLTAVNPLSQEMAAGALSIKIGKRPRDLLNPKAVKYMESVFSVKDEIMKKETREMSAQLGVTVSQVNEFFNRQRTRVRKFIRLSQEKVSSSKEVAGGVPVSNDPLEPIYPTPLNCLEPAIDEQGTCSSKPVEATLGLDESEKHFQENIFSEMRKEDTIGGQVKLMERILQIKNSSLLLWFLTNGGVMILATWLSQAASEEQTSVLHIILKVFCHLPLQKALPVDMSTILQSVNGLRLYEKSDISKRARTLLSKWSKMFATAQTLKKPSAMKSSSDAENEMLLKQSISEIMSGELLESNPSFPGDSSFETPESSRRLEATQPPKLLTSSADDSSKKPVAVGSPFQTRERRRVVMVEHPGQKPAGRSFQVSRPASVNRSRPLSADDIQKSKMRAQFMQNKYGKAPPSQTRPFVSPPKAQVQPQIEEEFKDPLVSLPPKVPVQQRASPSEKMKLDVEEPLWERCKKVQIKWKTLVELKIPDDWRVGTGEESTETEFQKNRDSREKETVYGSTQDIPCDPNEPWDREMEYDDSLTLEIPIEQLPEDIENEETEPLTCYSQPEPTLLPVSAAPAYVSNNNGSFAEADPQLLAELLKHPQLVFALQGGGLSGDEKVRLLDMIKSNGVAAALGGGTGLVNRGGSISTKPEEDSVPVSLPSPTPASDPVTSGWRTVARQEREIVSGMAQQQQQQQQLQARAQAFPQQTVPQLLSNNFSNMHPTNPGWAQNSGYDDPTHFPLAINRLSDRQLPPQPQSMFLPEQTRGNNHNYNQNQISNNPPYIQPHRPNHYNGYVQQGPPAAYRERNQYVGRAEYDSWSPEDDSPMRQPGWGGYPEQRVVNPNVNPNTNPNTGHYNDNYRSEFEQSNRRWTSSGYRDFNGPGDGKRQRR